MKDRKEGDKPRFFLHDEMKAWLRDNLRFQITANAMESLDADLKYKLGVNDLSIGHSLHISVLLDGETISFMGYTLDMAGYEKSIKTISNVLTTCMERINQLEYQNQELKRRIELLEQPLSI